MDDQATLALCDKFDLASIDQGPLGRGLLTGKFHAGTSFAANDMRRGWGWDFRKGRMSEIIEAHCDDTYHTNGEIDWSKVRPILFTGTDGGYWKLGEYLGKMGNAGKKLARQ